jgi:hypothetical protein
MIMQIENSEIPQKLRGVIRRKRCVVFIGSGLSYGIYHSWPDLVNSLCEKCGSARRVNRDSPPGEFLDAAQDAKLSDKVTYYNLLGEHFGHSVRDASVLYDILLSLPFECYLTVNFDPLLALKARTAKLPCSLPVHAYPSLDRKKMTNRSIHYLHGFIGEGKIPVEGTIVLARDEFDEAYGDNSNLMNLLVPTLAEEPILFIGCRLREPVMKRIFDICKKAQLKRQRIMVASGGPQSKPPPRFILLPKPEIQNDETGHIDLGKSQIEIEEQQRYYQDLEIEPVWYDAPANDHSALRFALERLAELPEVTPNHGWQGGEIYGS